MPIFLVIVPLILFVIELPIALLSAAVSRRGWIEAVVWYPQNMRITWEVADRHSLSEVHRLIRTRLGDGYEGLEWEGVRIIEMTRPAGLEHVTR